MTKLVPSGARVLIRKIDVPSKVKGIIIPQKFDSTGLKEGIIEAVGDGCSMGTCGVTAYYFGHASIEIRDPDSKVEFVIVNEKDIVATYDAV